MPPHYDSLIGKLVAYGDTREQAIARMRVALSEMVIEGIQTNIPLHQELMNDAAFVAGGVSIHYLEEKIAALKSIQAEPARLHAFKGACEFKGTFQASIENKTAARALLV